MLNNAEKRRDCVSNRTHLTNRHREATIRIASIRFANIVSALSVKHIASNQIKLHLQLIVRHLLFIIWRTQEIHC